MEPHLRARPQKTPFDSAEQKRLRALAVQKMKDLFLPNEAILKIVLIGSSIKGTFGSYAEPGFRGSLFSDFDFIVFVKDEYEIPASLEREIRGKPFKDEDMNLAYRARNFIEEKYDAEIFFIRESSMKNRHMRYQAESAGIPFGEGSRNPFVVIHEVISAPPEVQAPKPISAIFICGVNGVGKSTLIPYLKNLLPAEKYAVRDFDERGLPEDTDNAWRVSETKYWLEQASQSAEKGLITIICGFVKVKDFKQLKKEIGVDLKCILLDAQPETIRGRLTKRYTKNGVFNQNQIVAGKSVKELIEENIGIRKQLRIEFERLGCPIVDTSHERPAHVAEAVADLIQ